MGKRFQFTQARIRDLPLPEKGRAEYYDEEQKKLICRVSSTGNKSFAVLKYVNGTAKRVSIGQVSDISVPEARKRAQAILLDINSGIDPIAKKKRQKVEKATLRQVLELYLAERQLKPVTVQGYQYKLEQYFADWLDKPVRSISESMVLKRHKQLTKVGATTANTAMRVLRLVMNYAHAVGIVEVAPTDILKKARLWHKNNRRDRVIPSEKLRDWYQAVEVLPNVKAKVYLLMLLYMGIRSNEALKLEWSSVDLQRKLITLYNTKNGTDCTLPVPVPLISQLKDLQKENEEGRWVFPSEDLEKPMWLPKKAIASVVKVSGVEFSSHDCRRTFATIAEAVSLPLTMIKRLMNHSTTADVTGGYIVTQEKTLREASDKIARYIQSRIKKQEKVVQLR